MSLDARKNFAITTVATAPSPATSGTSLVVAASAGAKFPAAPFNAVVWPTGANPTSANAEIVRVTAVSTDTFTITRAQEGSTARTIVVGDQIMQAVTDKTLADIEAYLTAVSQPALLTPKITTSINDVNGNKIINFNPVASAVNSPQADNAATGGAGTAVVGFEAVGSDANLHFQAIGKGNGLTKVSILRQDNTTNSYKHNSVVLTGWGTITATAAITQSKAVTFGITFAAKPIVLISFGGDEAVASATYGNGNNSVQGQASAKCYAITTAGFTAYVWAISAWAAGNGVYYHWAAFGEL